MFCWVIILLGLGVFSTEVRSRKPILPLSSKFTFRERHHRVKRWEFSTYRVFENQDPPQRVTTLVSTFDDGKKGIRYSISGPGAETIFRVNPDSGELTALYRFDREKQSSYHLNVSARNLQGREVEDPTTITIEVQDVNDNKPRFPQSHYQASVKEMSKIGTRVAKVFAIDDDDPTGPYGRLRYSLLPFNSSVATGTDSFMIDPWTGQVKTTKRLDRESSGKYQLLVQARDNPGSPHYFTSNATLIVSVIDVNDNPPVFTERPYQATIPETAAIGSVVLIVQVTDADSLPRNIMTLYSIVPDPDSSRFLIETRNNKGMIKVKQKLDYETAINKQYHFTVTARNIYPESDLNLDYLHLQDTTDVIIMVTDVNEPPVFSKQQFNFSVREDMLVGYPINSVPATDPEGDSFTYWLDDKTKTFSIDPSTGFISLRKTLDRESKDSYEVYVMAGVQDSFSKAKVNLIVIDVNDNSPVPKDNKSLELILCEDPGAASLTLFPDITVMDADSEEQGPPFRYFAIESLDYKKNFLLVDNHNSTATLRTRHSSFFVTDLRDYQVQILVLDSGKPPRNSTFQTNIQVCHCPAREIPVCEATHRGGGAHWSILAALLLCLLSLIIVFIVFRRRCQNRHGSEVLIKASRSSSESEIRENFFSYVEEGGGEEDTSAFDLDALQRNYRLPNSLLLLDGRSDFINPHVNKTTLHKSRPFIPSQDIRNFIISKKSAEDSDDRVLAFDSLQVYGYEGEGSEAGSLSSLCSTATDSDQSYDYLRDWGPRFRCLADMYDSRRITTD